MGAAATLGDIGERVDLEIRAGMTFGPVQVTLQQDGGAAYDLTNQLPRARLKNRSTGSFVEMDVAVIAPASGGEFTFGMTAANSALLDKPGKMTAPPVAYDWELYVENGLLKLAVFYGEARVHFGV